MLATGSLVFGDFPAFGRSVQGIPVRDAQAKPGALSGVLGVETNCSFTRAFRKQATGHDLSSVIATPAVTLSQTIPLAFAHARKYWLLRQACLTVRLSGCVMTWSIPRFPCTIALSPPEPSGSGAQAVVAFAVRLASPTSTKSTISKGRRFVPMRGKP